MALGLLLLLIPVLVAVAGLAVTASSTATADAGPHQGTSFGNTPDQCAACHRIHTASGPKLLKEPSQTDLCLSCHSGTGAQTNVRDGVRVSTTNGLRGGGFVNAKMDPSLSGTPGSTSTSSTHTYTGASGTAWGGGAINSSANYGVSVNLACANCHDPHGSGQYRILRKQPTGTGLTLSDVLVTDEVTPNYEITYDINNRRDTGYAPATIGEWCSQCHTRYLAGANSGETDSGDAVFKYRHRTSGLTDECLACHVAHGTTATMGTNSGAVPWPNAGAGGGSNDSRLLHVNNRGTCMACHASIGG